ncbi:MAG TPA: ABC transporter ATP-binding protein [Steroidobacteraceae bacterium]|nr:ABC transporter ATP-binding protein [Steroidobacteraceae bacterium]
MDAAVSPVGHGAAARSAAAPPLAARAVGVRAGARQLVQGLDVEFSPGEVVAILGRNGSGKTLTLHTLAGLREPASGAVELDGVTLGGLKRRAVALRLGILPQDLEDAFVTTAMETVLIGRHPHLALWQWESAEDERLARSALAAVDMADCAMRRTDTLSGGEQRRVAVAALLAQQPAVFLLDEPTNHLDPHHQLVVLGLFRELARAGRTVITTLHDPTLAARFADRVLLLHGDGRWTLGPVGEALTEASLSDLYLAPMMELDKDGRRVFVSV